MSLQLFGSLKKLVGQVLVSKIIEFQFFRQFLTLNLDYGTMGSNSDVATVGMAKGSNLPKPIFFRRFYLFGRFLELHFFQFQK